MGFANTTPTRHRGSLARLAYRRPNSMPLLRPFYGATGRSASCMTGPTCGLVI